MIIFINNSFYFFIKKCVFLLVHFQYLRKNLQTHHRCVFWTSYQLYHHLLYQLQICLLLRQFRLTLRYRVYFLLPFYLSTNQYMFYVFFMASFNYDTIINNLFTFFFRLFTFHLFLLQLLLQVGLLFHECQPCLPLLRESL